MACHDSGGLTVDVKLLKQYLKKKKKEWKKCSDTNWLQIAINALLKLGAMTELACLVSKYHARLLGSAS